MKRNYVVPLRRGFQRTERHQRAKKASTVLREFLVKHMKSDSIKIGRSLNEDIWNRGIRKPPGKVSIVCEKDDEGIVWAELEGEKLPSELEAEKKAAEAKEKDKKKEAKKEEKATEKPKAAEKPKTEEKKADEKPKKEAKPAEKAEKKE